MNYTFPNTIKGGGLKSKVVFLPEEVGSDLPVTMWYFEPLELFAKSLHDLRILEGLCKQLQRKAQSTTTLSLGGLIQPLLVKRQP